MKKRLIIYFNYHPNGQADAACRFAVQQMAAVGQVLFVNNGPLQPESRQWAQGCCHTVLERENTGFDVGAYRDAILQIGLDMLLHYDEVVLMNYTLAGPVGDVAAMFAAMAPGAGFLGPDPPLCYAQPPLWRGKSHGAGAYSIPLCCGAFPHDGRLFCLLAGGRPARQL